MIVAPSLARLRDALADRRGAAAVEFAIIATPFAFMLFAIIQLALYFMVQVTLDNAAAIAARQLRTGQVQAQGSSDTVDKTALMTAICNNMSWLQNQCQGGVSSSAATQYLTVDVRTLSGFASTAGSPTLSSTGGASSNTCFYSGSAGSAVELRAYYRWQLLTPMLMASLQTFANGAAVLRATEVFQVEPNGETSSGTTTC